MGKIKANRHFSDWLVELPLAILIGMAGAWSLFSLYFWQLSIDQIHYIVSNYPIPGDIAIMVAVPGAVVILAVPGLRRDFIQFLRRLNRALFPLLIPVPFLMLFPSNYFCLLMPILAWGISAYRLGVTFQPRILRYLRRLSPSWGFLVAIIGFLGTVYWHWYIQNSAYNRFFLFYNDWGEYSDCYMRLAWRGANSWSDFLALAGHWNPLPNVVMTLILGIHASAKSVFAINALLIASSVPLIYWLARSARLRPAPSLCFMAIAFLNPVLNGQSLSMFYGYHPINFLVPLLAMFFICRFRGCLPGMIVCFVLTLLVQETVMIFWMGYALYWLIKRRWLAGVALFIFGVVGFLVLTMLIMPSLLGDGDGYSQMFHFAHLGNSPLEVLGSPILRPAVFWRTVFQWQNFAFALSLLLPLAFSVLIDPRLAVATLPLLAGVCLQHSPDWKNVVMQYGLEISMLLLIVSVRNAARLQTGRRAILLSFVGSGLPWRKHASVQLYGLCLGTLTLTLGSYFLFGHYAIGRMQSYPDAREVIRAIRSEVPSGGRVVATVRERAQFLFRNPTVGLDAKLRTGDTIILDLIGRAIGRIELEQYRAKLAIKPEIMPVTAFQCGLDWLGVYRVVPAGTPKIPLPFLATMTLEQFVRAGRIIEQDNPDFGVCLSKETWSATPWLMVRLLRPVDYDVFIEIGMEGERKAPLMVPFANGLVPAYAAKLGEVFLVQVPETIVENRIQVRILTRADTESIFVQGK